MNGTASTTDGRRTDRARRPSPTARSHAAPQSRLGAVDDPLEREADAAADQVLRMPDPGPALVSRRADGLLLRAAPTAERQRGSTDYRFDTYRITADDLLRETVLVRLNELDVPQLETYLQRVRDPDVASFITDLIDVRRREANAVGYRIVSNYMALTKQLQCPGGLCYSVARGRVERASREITGRGLTEALSEEEASTFDRIWGSLVSPVATWLEIPGHVRGKGAPGAMVFAGLGSFVEEDAIWAGDLQPGAVIQTWRREADAERVHRGETPTSYGHSFIFLRYRREGDRPGGAIRGIEIADQGFQSGRVLERSAYDWWIGANVAIRSPRRVVRPWSLQQERGGLP